MRKDIKTLALFCGLAICTGGFPDAVQADELIGNSDTGVNIEAMEDKLGIVEGPTIVIDEGAQTQTRVVPLPKQKIQYEPHVLGQMKVKALPDPQIKVVPPAAIQQNAQPHLTMQNQNVPPLAGGELANSPLTEAEERAASDAGIMAQ